MRQSARTSRIRSVRFAAVAMVLAASPVLAQETARGRATITGVITDATSGSPVPGVTVSIPSTSFQTTADDQGRYTLRNVPMGNQTLSAKRVGYSPSLDANVQINSANVVHNMTLSPVALALAAITTSATVDPTSGIKSPFAVSTVTAENLEVRSTGVATNLIGKVAGVQVTRAGGSTNGDEPWIQFRSMQSPGNRGASPLVIVDGVPLNMVRQTMFTGNNLTGGVGIVIPQGDVAPIRTSDIEGLDIESIELIKGAAAAALYGSLASGGVISIKTRRGNDIALDRTQIEARAEYGVDQIAKMPALRTHNYFLVNDQGQWINTSGALVARPQRVIDPDLMLDNPFAPGTYYNPVDQAFVPNRAVNTAVRVSRNSATSNFQVSYTRSRLPGTLRDADGSTNQSLRVNIDHQLHENLQLSVGANHSRTHNVPTVVNFATLFRFDPDINLLAPGTATGTKYRISPDSSNPTNLNPLYLQTISGNNDQRNGTQLSGNLTYRPLNWLTLVGNLGYNRQEGLIQSFQPPGLPSDEAGGITTGSLTYQEQRGDGLASYASATLLKDIGSLTARLTGQVESNHRKFLDFSASSVNFSTVGAQTLTAGATKTNFSVSTEATVNSGFGSLALDYGGKYIGDFLFRREGSSLFGRQNRYHNYSRASAAWLLSRESWWPSALSKLTLAKLRYSYGSSGNEPDFTDQYESVVLSTTGFVRARLGNAALTPETKSEHEMGMDFIWNNRSSLTLTYSRAKTSSGIFEVEAPNVTGFNTYTQNAGRAHGDSYEASFEGQIVQGKSFRWTMTANLDRSKSTVDTYGRSCYNEAPQFVRICDGVPPTEYWGLKIMRSTEDLPASRRGTLTAWDINDEGYLVPVGVGNRWYDGMKKRLWGTTVLIDGITYNWGVPQAQFSDSSNSLAYQRIGDWAPRLNFGYGNKFRYGNVQLYVLFSGVVGGQIYNGFLETYKQSLNSPLVDQTNRPDSLKKPYLYYQNLPGGGLTVGGTGFGGMNNDQFVASGAYLKFAEAQVQYTFESRRHAFVRRLGADRLTFEVDGTNLMRWDNGYQGLDQEGFFTLSNQQRIRFDAIRYPLARRITTAITAIF